MVAIKIVALATVLSSAVAQPGPAAEWTQCGGNGWTGPIVCAPGLTCVVQSQWFSQCLRPVSISIPVILPTTKSVTTSKKTTAKTTTTSKKTTIKTTTTKTTTTAKVVTTAPPPSTTLVTITSVKPTTTAVPGSTAPPWGQCGGQGWTGPLKCSTGQICVYQNQFFSTCQPDPAVSTTTRVPATTTSVSITPKETFNYLFSFGDSYSQTGFDLAGTKPSVGNQLGNPSLPGYTTSGGLNWIGDLLTSNTQLLSYNLASGGATTDANLVTPFAPTVLSLVDQVTQFTTNLAPAPAYAPWKATDSLFAVWIGVNDVGNAWYRPEWPELSVKIVDRYFEQVQLLYNAGGRKFVFLNVPPIDKAPANLGADAASTAALKAAIQTYNGLIEAGKAKFKTANPGVYAEVINIFSKFDYILDHPTLYGAANASCYNADGVSCLWWNDYHPGLVIQNGVADDVAVIVGLYL